MRGSSPSARRASGRSPGFSPPFSAAAEDESMRPYAGGPPAWASASMTPTHTHPGRPSEKTVVRRLSPPVIARRAHPARARFQDVRDAADHPSVVDQSLLRMPVGRCGAILGDCPVSQTWSRFRSAPFGSRESQPARHANHSIGPDPKTRPPAPRSPRPRPSPHRAIRSSPADSRCGRRRPGSGGRARHHRCGSG